MTTVGQACPQGTLTPMTATRSKWYYANFGGGARAQSGRGAAPGFTPLDAEVGTAAVGLQGSPEQNVRELCRMQPFLTVSLGSNKLRAGGTEEGRAEPWSSEDRA